MTRHRFPIGTQYTTTAKAGRAFITTLHTVTEQLTVTNSRGEIVKAYYESAHEFCGQTVKTSDVVDTTIARGLTPEFQHLLKA